MKFLLQNYPDTSTKLGVASEVAKGSGHQHLTGQVAFIILSWVQNQAYCLEPYRSRVVELCGEMTTRVWTPLPLASSYS